MRIRITENVDDNAVLGMHSARSECVCPVSSAPVQPTGISLSVAGASFALSTVAEDSSYDVAC